MNLRAREHQAIDPISVKGMWVAHTNSAFMFDSETLMRVDMSITDKICGRVQLDYREENWMCEQVYVNGKVFCCAQNTLYRIWGREIIPLGHFEYKREGLHRDMSLAPLGDKLVICDTHKLYLMDTNTYEIVETRIWDSFFSGSNLRVYGQNGKAAVLQSERDNNLCYLWQLFEEHAIMITSFTMAANTYMKAGLMMLEIIHLFRGLVDFTKDEANLQLVYTPTAFQSGASLQCMHGYMLYENPALTAILPDWQEYLNRLKVLLQRQQALAEQHGDVISSLEHGHPAKRQEARQQSLNAELGAVKARLGDYIFVNPWQLSGKLLCYNYAFVDVADAATMLIEKRYMLEISNGKSCLPTGVGSTTDMVFPCKGKVYCSMSNELFEIQLNRLISVSRDIMRFGPMHFAPTPEGKLICIGKQHTLISYFENKIEPINVKMKQVSAVHPIVHVAGIGADTMIVETTPRQAVCVWRLSDQQIIYSGSHIQLPYASVPGLVVFLSGKSHKYHVVFDLTAPQLAARQLHSTRTYEFRRVLNQDSSVSFDADTMRFLLGSEQGASEFEQRRAQLIGQLKGDADFSVKEGFADVQVVEEFDFVGNEASDVIIPNPFACLDDSSSDDE